MLAGDGERRGLVRPGGRLVGFGMRGLPRRWRVLVHVAWMLGL